MGRRLGCAGGRDRPSLCRRWSWREDVRWYGVGREVDYGEDSHSVAFCLRGASQDDADIHVMISAHWENLCFTIHEEGPGEWRRMLDTSCGAGGLLRRGQRGCARVALVRGKGKVHSCSHPKRMKAFE